MTTIINSRVMAQGSMIIIKYKIIIMDRHPIHMAILTTPIVSGTMIPGSILLHSDIDHILTTGVDLEFPYPLAGVQDIIALIHIMVADIMILSITVTMAIIMTLGDTMEEVITIIMAIMALVAITVLRFMLPHISSVTIKASLQEQLQGDQELPGVQV